MTSMFFFPDTVLNSTAAMANAGYCEISSIAVGVTAADRAEFQVDEIPQSFLSAMDDFEAGRVIDLDRALEDKPPGD